MTPDEALPIFERLCADQSVILCAGKLSGWTFALRGRVVSASSEEIVIVSIDRKSGSITFRLDTEDLLIRYVDPCEAPTLTGIGERDKSLAGLRVGLPVRLRPSDLRNRLLEAPQRDMLLFLELPREEA